MFFGRYGLGVSSCFFFEEGLFLGGLGASRVWGCRDLGLRAIG